MWVNYKTYLRMVTRTSSINQEIYFRLRALDDGRLMGPYTLTLFMPSTCPLNCLFCPLGLKNLIKSKKDVDEIKTLAYWIFECSSNTIKEIERCLKKDNSEIKREILLSTKKEIINKIDKYFKVVNNAIGGGISILFMLRDHIVDDKDPTTAKIIAYIIKMVEQSIVSEFEAEMSIEDYIRVIKESRELGVKEVIIGGLGEPLTKRDMFLRIAREVKNQGMYGRLITSGYLLNETIINILIDIGWDEILVSMDSVVDIIRDEMRGQKGSFRKTVENIKALNWLKKTRKVTHPILTINIAITKKNYRELMDVLDFAKRYDIHTVAFNPLLLRTKQAKNLALSKEEFEEFKKMAANVLKKFSKYGISTNLPLVLKLDRMYGDSIISKLPSYTSIMEDLIEYRDTKKIEPLTKTYLTPSNMCISPFLEIVVESSGNVRRCCYPLIPLINENVREKSLKQIWFGERYEHIRKNFLVGNFPEECKYYCSPLVLYIQKQILEEYIAARDIIDRTRPLRGKLKKILFTVDEILEKIIGVKGIMEYIILIAGYRVRDIPL